MLVYSGSILPQLGLAAPPMEFWVFEFVWLAAQRSVYQRFSSGCFNNLGQECGNISYSILGKAILGRRVLVWWNDSENSCCVRNICSIRNYSDSFFFFFTVFVVFLWNLETWRARNMRSVDRTGCKWAKYELKQVQITLYSIIRGCFHQNIPTYRLPSFSPFDYRGSLVPRFHHSAVWE